MYVGHYELELESIPLIDFKVSEPTTFGEYIRRLRILKAWSQRRLGQSVGVFNETVVAWEKGEYIPQRKSILKLINVLDGDSWETIRFDGVITDRQRRILTYFDGKTSFKHRDCMELIGSGYLRDDLKYLVDLGVLERNENTYRVLKYEKLKTLGDLIRKHRLEKGLVARELGNLVGVTESTILNWEKNRTCPCHDQLLQLKEHLKIDPFAIVAFDGTISERERAILELVKEKGSVTRIECQNALGLKQRDAQNGLYSLYMLGVLNRELGKRNTAKYLLKSEVTL